MPFPQTVCGVCAVAAVFASFCSLGFFLFCCVLSSLLRRLLHLELQWAGFSLC